MVKQVSEGIKSSLNENTNVLTIIKGISAAYIVTIPTFIIFAFILAYTEFPEKYISPAVIITTLISLLTAGSIVTRNLRSKGWLNGGIAGFIYILVLYLFSSIVYKDFSINSNVITMALIGMITGAIGGIIGINLKKGSHSKHKR